MKKKEQMAALVEGHADMLRCPICGGAMHVEALKSLVCGNNHSFDFAKQGYVNIMTRPVKTQYDKNLFQHRRAFILESGFYREMHEEVSGIISRLQGRPLVLDAGSGEGSHLDRILDGVDGVGIGVDIAKEGIMLAAKYYPQSIWLVGDLAKLPIRDGSMDAIVNILSPANYAEFNRVLSPDGLVVKVVPESGYLKELREALYRDTDRETYDNTGTVSLFEENYEIVERRRVTDEMSLDRMALEHLIEMSPLAWNHASGELDDFIAAEKTVTLDLEILVGRR
ncbi:putative RNA methyltransferase [Salinicoccus roseus]|uniref:putative RNA methyltransferase n=1 Tax=Salinicoccus roseus TaxID=45670 RepID=UPI00230168BE|nr:methyltransferase domain-containing protein [Salinicoccus roseus]